MKLRRAWQAVVVLAALVVVLAAIVGWEMLQTLRADGANRASQDAQRAARAAAQAIMSYGYRTLSADKARARSFTTGAFRRQYESDAPKLLAIARQRSEEHTSELQSRVD